MKARSNPFASAVAEVRGARRAIEQLVDDGALDSTVDDEPPISEEERVTVLERRREAS